MLRPYEMSRLAIAVQYSGQCANIGQATKSPLQIGEEELQT